MIVDPGTRPSGQPVGRSAGRALTSVTRRRWRAWTHYLNSRARPWGHAALALWCGAGSAVALGQHWLSQAQHLAAQGESARARAIVQATAAPPAAPAAGLLERLPPSSATPDFIEALHRDAQRSGVAVDSADYRAPATAAPMVRLQVVLPAVGSYAALTRWMGGVLHRHPNVALDEWQLQRDIGTAAPAAAAAPILKARVVFSHYAVQSGPQEADARPVPAFGAPASPAGGRR